MSVESTFKARYLTAFKNLHQSALQGFCRGDALRAHDWASLLMLRLCTLRFVQSAFAPDDPNFLHALWDRYRSKGIKEGFYRSVLVPLFRHLGEGEGLSDVITWMPRGLSLYEPHPSDPPSDWTPADGLFEKLFEKGESPFDLPFSVRDKGEDFVSPDALESAYEQSLKLPSERARRRTSGIYYTPPQITRLMTLLSLTEILSRRSGFSVPSVLGAFTDDGDRLGDDGRVVLSNLLSSLRICDPACGAGAFLVAVMEMLDKAMGVLTGGSSDPFARRAHILQHQLYGADVSGAAVEFARVRLWLFLIAAAPFPFSDLAGYYARINLKSGDSLVQVWKETVIPWRENLALMRSKSPPAYDAHIASRQRFVSFELDRKTWLTQEREAIERLVSLRKAPATSEPIKRSERQLSLFETNTPGALSGDAVPHAKEEAAQATPFVWEIAFPEVFQEENAGFDIVIGNPPYVRRHHLMPPPSYGGETSPRETYLQRLQLLSENESNGISDLYTHFFHLGSALSRDDGAICYITPFSLLSAQYAGRLLRSPKARFKPKLFVQDHEKCMFQSVEIESVIGLFTPRQEQETKFIRLSRPLATLPSADVVLAALDNGQTREKEMVVRVMLAKRLFDHVPLPLFDGSKKGAAWRRWSVYLEDTEIMAAVAEHPRTVPLGAIAAVRRGGYPKPESFFVLKPEGEGQYFSRALEASVHLPPQAVKPILTSARECVHHTLRKEHVEYVLFLPTYARGDRLVEEYLRRGIEMGISNTSSIMSGIRAKSNRILVPEFVLGRYFFVWNEDGIGFGPSFYDISPFDGNEELLYALLNTTFSFLFMEFNARKPGAALSAVGPNVLRDIPILHPAYISPSQKENLIAYGRSIRSRPIYTFAEELQMADRKAIDAIVGEILGFEETFIDRVRSLLGKQVETRRKKRLRRTNRANAL